MKISSRQSNEVIILTDDETVLMTALLYNFALSSEKGSFGYVASTFLEQIQKQRGIDFILKCASDVSLKCDIDDGLTKRLYNAGCITLLSPN